ncbi:MAG TPA: HEAT repeat domain-containing protein [Gemmatimonadales bacterium]|jgi:HEAT repeat protein/beta-lactamase regulating signal transducer with metallopeptidase domain
MNAISALGWALVHFAWQGATLALLLAVTLTVLPATAARTRYTFALFTLTLMLALPIGTGVRLFNRANAHVPADAPPTAMEPATNNAAAFPAPARAMAVESHAQHPSVVAPLRLQALLEPALPWLVVLWLLGVIALSARLAHGWMMARRLRTQGTREISAALQQILSRLARRLRVTRPVRLVESLVIEVPAVVGWLRPVILVPTSALSGLTPQQLEVLLAHELAHVRRYDYVVNIMQCMIETLLFYHPAVWWVSRRVREEREHCCDDLVVATCGDPQLYASALVGMERLRPATPRLALAATGGSLLHRVQRLLVPSSIRPEYFPRWSAGIAGILAVTVVLLATGSDRIAEASATPTLSADTTRTAPDTVVRAPDPSQSLAQRWEWARTEARQLSKRAFWIGYTIPRPAWLDHSVYVDRGTEVKGENITISGRMYGNFQGLMFRGVRLPSLTGSGDSDDIAMLFGFRSDQGGKPVLTNVHVASAYLPVDFRGRTLLWLGGATDAQSLPIVQELLAATSNPDLREDVVAAVGIHGSSDVVVPVLVRLLTSREPEGVRQQAAEWLGFHPTAAAVVALSAAARSDVSGDVRREAAEALGDNTLPAATDSLIAVAKTATDADVRREAVEGLGQKTSDRAFATLVSIARTDADDDVAREAVETLGELPNGRGLPAVQDVARSHPRPDVRREAIETLGDNLPRAEAITLMKSVATNDPEPDVQRDAIEKLGELAPTAETVQFLSGLASSSRSEDVQRQSLETLGEIGEAGLPAVIDIARTHVDADIRRAAVETIGEKAQPAQAFDILAQIARRDKDSDVQRQAVETLGDLRDERAYDLLVDIARTHPSSDVRRQAIETLGESGHKDSVRAVLGDLARRTNDPDGASEAIEALGDMKDARALAIVARIARAPGDPDLRHKAMETYVDQAPSDSGVALLKSLVNDQSEDVRSNALEMLEGMDNGAGIPVLIEIARSHPNREVRADALRRLAESDDPRAQQVFEGTLRRP